MYSYLQTSYTLQKIGAGLLATAFGLFWVGEIGYSYGTLIAAGILNLYLVIKDRRTISQWIQNITYNKTIDYSVMGILIGSVIYQIFKNMSFVKGMTTCLPVLIIFLALHLFGNKD